MAGEVEVGPCRTETTGVNALRRVVQHQDAVLSQSGSRPARDERADELDSDQRQILGLVHDRRAVSGHGLRLRPVAGFHEAVGEIDGVPLCHLAIPGFAQIPADLPVRPLERPSPAEPFEPAGIQVFLLPRIPALDDAPDLFLQVVAVQPLSCLRRHCAEVGRFERRVDIVEFERA